MIGKAYTCRLPYYDRISETQRFKSRPCLVIGQADEGDYVILPISSVTDRRRIDLRYDIPLNKSRFSFVDKDCFLRTHKQTVANVASLTREIADFKSLYPETYLLALEKVEEFQNKMIKRALE